MITELNKVAEDVLIVQDSFDEYMDTVIAAIKNKKPYIYKGELRYTAVEQGGWGGLLGATHSSRIKLKLLNEEVETNLMFLAEPFAALASVFGMEYPYTYINRAWLALLKNHAHDGICGAAVEQAHEDMLYSFSISKTIAQEVGGP